MGIEALASSVSIHLHFEKISGYYQLRISTLLKNYAIKSLLERRHIESSSLYCLSLNNILLRQQLKIKSSIINVNSHLNSIFPSFDSLDHEFSSGTQLINIFPSRFSFHHAICKNKESKDAHIYKLDKCIFHALSNSKSAIVVSDASSDTSIKNNVTTFIIYIHLHSNPVMKTIDHTVNIMSTEAKIFAIRCDINQATQIHDIGELLNQIFNEQCKSNQ